MYKIGTLNKISPVGLARFTDDYTVTENIDEANGIILRSYNMHEDVYKRQQIPDIHFDPDLPVASTRSLHPYLRPSSVSTTKVPSSSLFTLSMEV